MRGEAFERGAVQGVERSSVEPTHGDRRRELAVKEDRDADQRPQADVADRWDGRRVGGVIVDRDRGAGPQHGADDPHLGGRMDTDDALTRAGAGGDVELFAAANVDRRVVRVHEKQRATGDRVEQRHGLGLRCDLGRQTLETLAAAERVLGA